MNNYKYVNKAFFLLAGFLFLGSPLLAQDKTPEEEQAEIDSLNEVAQSIVETTIDYASLDSSKFDIFTQTMYLYGKAKVTYGKQEITAAVIELNMPRTLVKAYGLVDSTGTLIGSPVFKDDGVEYNAEEITYNYKTKKGVINKIITEQNEGFVTGDRVKKTPDNAFFLQDALYTTCNLAEPHFGIRSKKLKLAPNKYVISGPFNLEVNNVPTPFGFALGLFPIASKRTSGLLFPTYGESRERGFFLRNGGFYWAVNDYIGAKFTGEIYSLGGWGFQTDWNYKKRYKYNGNMSFSYRNVQRQLDDLTTSTTTDYWLKWSHTPESRGTSRFSASVNAGTASFNRNNSLSVSNFLAPAFNSNISYNKTFEGTPFAMAASVRHNQNTITNIVNVNPQMSLTMKRIFPFQSKKGGSSKRNIFNQLSFSYNGNLRGELTNNPNASGIRFPFSSQIVGAPDVEIEPDTVDFFSEFGTVLENFDYGFTHRIPISTNFTLLKNFQFAPSINYTENWYPRRFNYTWVDSLNAVKVDTINQISRSYQYNFGIGTNTRIYGFYFLKGGHTIRHTFTPTVSYSFQPDFSTPNFGFYQELQTDENGTSRRFPVFVGGGGVPPANRSSAMSFGLENQLELKVRSGEDSTETFTKMPLIQNAGIRSSYNFAADSFNLANFSLSARTTILKKLNINISGNIDPYAYEPVSVDPETGEESEQRRRTRFLAWNRGQGIGQLTNVNIALSTNFRPDDFKKKPKDNKDTQSEENQQEEESNDPNEIIEESNLSEDEKEELKQIFNNPLNYVDFNVPWSLNMNYSLRLTRNPTSGESRIVQTFNFSGDFSLTPKWKVSFNSGYDFVNKEISFTTFNIHRDLHCWDMALSWVPFGQRQSYSIDIKVKSSILQDLKLSKRNSFFDR